MQAEHITQILVSFRIVYFLVIQKYSFLIFLREEHLEKIFTTSF